MKSEEPKENGGSIDTEAAGEITELLTAWSGGEQSALDRLVPLVYEELRRLAHIRLYLERSDHSLQATELVNEAYIRLLEWRRIEWRNRVHFFAVAAKLMRNILVDYARSRMSEKRGSGVIRIALEDIRELSDKKDVNLITLDECLTSLEAFDPHMSRIVELRYFGGLTIDETAEFLGTSPSSISRDWKFAKTWLLRELSKY